MNVLGSSQMQPHPQIAFYYAFLATHNILLNTFFMGRYTSYNPRFRSKLIFLSIIYLPMYLRIFPNVLFKFLSLCFDYVSCLTGISLSLSLLFIKMNRPDSNPFFPWQLLCTVQLTLNFSFNPYFLKNIMCYFHLGNQFVSCSWTEVFLCSHLCIHFFFSTWVVLGFCVWRELFWQ